MHHLLLRQLRSLGLREGNSPDAHQWAALEGKIGDAFSEFEAARDRREEEVGAKYRDLTEQLADLERRNAELSHEVEQHARRSARLEHSSSHDPLTGLPNRRVLLERLEACLDSSSDQACRDIAVLFVDLDDFKLINDSLGHEIGDEVLAEAARRLSRAVADVNCGRTLVARIGGDEFVILLENMFGPSMAVRLADLIGEGLARPMEVEGNELFLTASIGIALGSSSSDDSRGLMRDADTAMYRAKMSGKGHYTIFDQHMHTEAVRRLRLEQELRWSLDRDRFGVVYQPIVNLETGCITGLEALMRWDHPSDGTMTPDRFIAVAESSGLIVPLGKVVRKQIIADMKNWEMQHPGMLENLTIAMNVSKREMIEVAFIDTLDWTLAEAGLNHRQFVLEISESTMTTDSRVVATVLGRLRDRGVAVHMDDFGTGGSSLSSLHELPLDAVKIDQSFTARITESRDHAAITLAIVTLAHNLGLDIVAEGIEEAEQLVQLQACECRQGQGFLFSHPLPADEIAGLLSLATPPWQMSSAA